VDLDDLAKSFIGQNFFRLIGLVTGITDAFKTIDRSILRGLGRATFWGNLIVF